MKALCLYFHMMLFVCQNFLKMEFANLVEICLRPHLAVKGLKQTTEEHSPLHKIRYLTGQESGQSFLLWTLQANLSSVNSEEPFEVRHYLSKTLQLFTKSTGSASEWFLSTIYLSYVGLFSTVGHTKKAVDLHRSKPLISLVSFNLHLHCWKFSFNLSTLTIPPAFGPEALDFFRRLPRGRMVADKKEQGF